MSVRELRTVIAASSAAVVSVLAGFPFDSIKTRMQTHHYDSIISCVKTTYVEEGTKGFFRGMIPPLITVSIIKSASFSIYEGTKKALVRDGVFKNDTIQSTMALSTVSGSVSGAFIALLSCPLELIKIQRQLELILLKNQIASGQMPIHEVTEASSWKSAKQIVGRKARDALGTGIYFGSYESAKRLLSKDGSNSGPLVHFMSGGLCGMLSWLFVFPVDAIKTNLQKDIMLEKPKYSNALECASYLCMSKYLESFLL
ncbi:hypothetical protein RO3G_12401 [Rhizopus delemar RA 99-880]|uniref:Mitochondrial carrier n=1 Tax=Rhizopus delemar (strain RA 99-880 / ATCC MYA-4621 / FGSC 9543 / NRRL 43880) TaxID=246409 RepID=I1CGW0_RHIO9|nr:hypothetical protein RO3G_12401 [Rhizopus delemar RA 99-880]|eukprot:EIE87690.1 hypothetical protein RO3G_12401 [Rhizopus delemar RA 99-880]